MVNYLDIVKPTYVQICQDEELLSPMLAHVQKRGVTWVTPPKELCLEPIHPFSIVLLNHSPLNPQRRLSNVAERPPAIQAKAKDQEPRRLQVYHRAGPRFRWDGPRQVGAKR